jgi:hypothetical protein
MRVGTIPGKLRIRWLAGLAVMAVWATSSCMYQPFDGQRVKAREPVTFGGFSNQPDTLIAIEAELPLPRSRGRDYEFQVIGWAKSAHLGGALFKAEEIKYYMWTTSVEIPERAWRGGQARVRATVGGNSAPLTTVRSDWAECYSAQSSAGDFKTNCAANDENVAVLVRTD